MSKLIEKDIKPVEKKKKKSFADRVPELLEGNLFDRGTDAFHKVVDLLNLTPAVKPIAWWSFAFPSFRFWWKVLFDWKQTGFLNSPYNGSFLLVSNHQSVLDPFLMGPISSQEVCFMSKRQNFEMPIFKSILSFFGGFSVDREAAPTAVLDKAVELLHSGSCVAMFPEGTRSPDGSLGPFKTGAARIFLDAKVPYVPVCILGSMNVLPKNSLKFKAFQKVEVRAGAPVYPPVRLSGSFTHDDVKQIRDEMREKVKNLMDGTVDPVSKIIITPKHPSAIRDAKILKEGLSIS